MLKLALLCCAASLTLAGSIAGAAAQASIEERFPPLPLDGLTQEQAAVAQAAPTSGLPSSDVPLGMFERVPEVGKVLLSIGTRVRTENGLSPRQNQIAILMAARAWTTQRIWAAHAQSAGSNGLAPTQIKAIARGERPTALSPADAVVWRLADELLYHRQIGDRAFEEGTKLLGAERVVNLTLLVGFQEAMGMLELVDAGDQTGPLRPLAVAVAPLAPGALGPVPSFTPLAEGEGPSSGEFKIAGGRFRPPSNAQMTPDQQVAVTQLLNSWRHSVSSVFIPLLASPRMATTFEPLGTVLNPRSTVIDNQVRNLAALMATRHWGAQFEYWASHRNSIRAGLTEAQVEAVREGATPPDLSPKLAAAYALCAGILHDRTVDPAVLAAARRQLGDRDTIGAVMVLGHYGMVAGQLQALDRYPMPAGVAAELPGPWATPTGTARDGRVR